MFQCAETRMVCNGSIELHVLSDISLNPEKKSFYFLPLNTVQRRFQTRDTQNADSSEYFRFLCLDFNNVTCPTVPNPDSES